MASEKATELRYIPARKSYGSYIPVQLTMQESLSSFALLGGSQTSTFQALGKYVVSLKKSYITFDILTPAQANVYPWMYGACVSMFKNVQVFPLAGNQAMNLDQFHHYSKMLLGSYRTAQCELESNDPADIVYKSNVAQAQNKLPASGNNCTLPWSEAQYAINLANLNTGTNGPIAVNQPTFNHFKLPFSLFKGTPLECPLDTLFGGSVNIIFTWENPSNFIWGGTSLTNPDTGVAAWTGGATISNMYLWLAVEQDPIIIEDIYKMFNTGYSFLWTVGYKMFQQTMQAGSTMNINLPPITRGQGKYLKRIYVAFFNSNETNNTALDNNNNSTMTDTTTNWILTFQTMVDGQTMQQKYLSMPPYFNSTAAGTNTEGLGYWDQYKPYFAGSVIQNAGILGSQLVYIEDFTERNSRLLKFFNEEELSVEGLDMDVRKSLQWQFNTTTNNIGTRNVYVFIEIDRIVTISPAGVVVA